MVELPRRVVPGFNRTSPHHGRACAAGFCTFRGGRRLQLLGSGLLLHLWTGRVLVRASLDRRRYVGRARGNAIRIRPIPAEPFPDRAPELTRHVLACPLPSFGDRHLHRKGPVSQESVAYHWLFGGNSPHVAVLPLPEPP